MKTALLVTAVVATAMAFAMRESVAASPTMWIGLLLPYLVLGVLALQQFQRDGTLREMLRVRGGDFTIGFLIAAVVFGGAYGVRHLLFGPGSSKTVWLFHIALQLGSVQPSPKLFIAVAIVGALEELVWRGLVLSAVTDSLGARRAWPVAAVLYAAAHLPTVFTLSDPQAGPNPLLPLAALGAGIVWSFAARVFGRLPPLMVSHAIFTYFAVALLLPRFS
ncbi:MAG TPA: CPBP family intramembrane glutamic endopeptidase [Polyangiaceae bacterium]|nr:CPBP family intramembrane glutamic endopeptidase [Polyangiaceae bacterium]